MTSIGYINDLIENDEWSSIQAMFGSFSIFLMFMQKRGWLDDLGNTIANYSEDPPDELLIELYNIDRELFNRIVLKDLSDVEKRGDKFYIVTRDFGDVAELFCRDHRKFVESILTGDNYVDYYDNEVAVFSDVIENLNQENLQHLKNKIIESSKDIKISSETKLLEVIANYQNHPDFVEINSTNIDKIVNDKESIEFILDNYLSDIESSLINSYNDASRLSLEDKYYTEVWSELDTYFTSHSFSEKTYGSKIHQIIELEIRDFSEMVLGFINDGVNFRYYGSYISSITDTHRCLRVSDQDYDFNTTIKYMNENFYLW